METEEAIEILIDEIEMLHCGKKLIYYSEGERAEAYHMAIKALHDMEYGILDREIGGNIKYTDSTDWKG